MRRKVFVILTLFVLLGFMTVPPVAAAEPTFEFEDSGTITVFDNTPGVPEASPETNVIIMKPGDSVEI